MASPTLNTYLPTGRNQCFTSYSSPGVPPAPALGYGYSTGTNLFGTTGNWIPVAVGPDGRMAVDIGVPNISVSGNVSIGAGVTISGGTITVTGQPTLEALVRQTNTFLLGLSGAQLAPYTFNIQAVTASQVNIPAGAKSWSVAIESGVGYINSVPISASASFGGGGYGGGGYLTTPIAVGMTGGRAIVTYEV
jgi:hypothetical protein